MIEGDPKDNKKPSEGKAWWQPALLMFGRLSGWVIGPVIVGAVIGQWLDKKYDKEPWLFLASVGIAFIISIIGLVKNTMEAYRKIEEEGKINKEENKKKK